MDSADPILVIGSTGQQGGAVARELLSRGHEVHALTRTPDSPAALRLAAQGAKIVYGDLDDPASIGPGMSEVNAVFSMHTFLGTAGVDGEVRRGKAAADIAKDVGVAHVVYSSVDGAERSSGVPHFESKWAIEQYARALELPLTVLRPTTFMESFTTNARPQMTERGLVVRFALPPDKPLQMVATADLGFIAADAFERPAEHIGQAIALAGDALTGPMIAAAFQAVTGTPARYEQQPLDEIRAFSDDLALMFEWLTEFGYDRADIAALRQRHPQLRTLQAWLAETRWQPEPESRSRVHGGSR